MRCPECEEGRIELEDGSSIECKACGGKGWQNVGEAEGPWTCGYCGWSEGCGWVGCEYCHPSNSPVPAGSVAPTPDGGE